MTGLQTTSGNVVARDIGHAIAQVNAGQQVLWDALVSCLIKSELVNPAELVERIAIAHRQTPEAQTGPLSRSTAQCAVRALYKSVLRPEEKFEDAPQWVKAIIAELEPHAPAAVVAQEKGSS